MEELNKLIGERIRKCRTDLKMSQNELAKRINRGRRTIVSWENGTEKKCPPIEALMEMCKIFNCEIGYLVGEFDCKKRVTADICEATGLSEAAAKPLFENKIELNRIADGTEWKFIMQLSSHGFYADEKHYEAASICESDGSIIYNEYPLQFVDFCRAVNRSSSYNLFINWLIETGNELSDYIFKIIDINRTFNKIMNHPPLSVLEIKKGRLISILDSSDPKRDYSMFIKRLSIQKPKFNLEPPYPEAGNSHFHYEEIWQWYKNTDRLSNLEKNLIRKLEEFIEKTSNISEEEIFRRYKPCLASENVDQAIKSPSATEEM